MIRLSVAIILLAFSAAGLVQADEMPRTISVTGTGYVTVPPDMARISLSVSERDPSLPAAQQAVAEVTARVLEFLDGLDIDRKKINSTGATVQPNYRWNRDTQEQELIGYIAQRRIEVEVLDLEILGKVVEGAVAVGVNQVSRPALDSTARRGAYRQALAKAATDARENAQTLADAMDVKLGPVMQMSVGGRVPEPRPMMRAQAETMAAVEIAPETYNAGDIRFDASVSAVFELIME